MAKGVAKNKEKQLGYEESRPRVAPGRGLGRGLGALISEQPDVSSDELKKTGRIQLLRLNQLVPNHSQPRQLFDENKLQELADSMVDQGVISPLIVTPTERQGEYMIVAGERRWRAAKMVGLETVPAVIRELDQKEIQKQALVDNVVRENLNPVEEAFALQRLLGEYEMTQDNLASALGQSRSAITNKLRLLKLPDTILDLIRDGQLSPGHARALLALSDATAQRRAADAVLVRQLNVRDTERLVKKMVNPPEPKTAEETAQEDRLRIQVNAVEERLRRIFGSKVKIEDVHGKGKIVIYYQSGDERERLIDMLSEA